MKQHKLNILAHNKNLVPCVILVTMTGVIVTRIGQCLNISLFCFALRNIVRNSLLFL